MSLFAASAVSLALCWVPEAGAQRAREVRALTSEPIAPRGGVLMLPLVPEPPARGWPQRATLRLPDGRVLEGRIAWVHAAAARTSHRWADDPRGLAIRPIHPEDDPAQPGAGSPYLLARLPREGAGTLALGGQTLRPTWCDLPPAPAAAPTSPPRAALRRTASPELPDPDSPFEYWRWVLLAEYLELQPPPPSGDNDLARLAASHYAELWQIGLARLARLDPALESRCRHLLTRTAWDRARPLAAWVADPQQVADLLAQLVNFALPDHSMLQRVRAWVESQRALLIWVESEFGEQVRLGVINRDTGSFIARFAWEGADEVPIAVQLHPGALTRVTLDRPPAPPAPEYPMRPATSLEPRMLNIDIDESRYRVPFGPSSVAAQPPGVFFAALRPPLTLGDMQGVGPPAVGSAYATFAQVRRLDGRWEVFVDCRRPPAPDPGPPLPVLSRTDVHEALVALRGHEAVTVLIGPDTIDAERVRLTVSESGAYDLAGATEEATLQVHQRSYADRWYVRIVLPGAWLNPYPDRPTFVACVRTHGDMPSIETGPGAVLPWRIDPAPLALDLSRWDEPQMLAPTVP